MDSATPCTPAADYRTDATRVDGWTPARQALFLEALADSGLVDEACRAAGMSVTSAYVLRRRSDGVAFALGWKAAILLSRDRLLAILMKAAHNGVETATSSEDGVTRRRAINFGLSRGVLDRLDRYALALDNPEAATARAIASAFEKFINLVAAGGGKEDVTAFLERHPDPLANARTKLQAREAGRGAGELEAGDRGGGDTGAGMSAQARKLLEKSPIYLDDADEPETPDISARNLRRLNRVRKRLLGAR